VNGALLLVGALAVAAASPATIDCTAWTLDGYRIGMGRDEILAVRSITLHTEGQAQVVEPGRFSGVLVLDSAFGLAKWDVHYKTTDGNALRAELRERYGDPASEVTGDLPGDPSEPMRQRRTIWWNSACDVAIIVYENSSVRGTPMHSVQATLVRASRLSKGFLQSKTLLP
jgi:hypothetical protein